MSAADEGEIQTLIDALTDAWKRGDAKAYGARVMPDATFTNVNGGSDARHSTAVTPRSLAVFFAGRHWR
jgi:ketosteroid isomerase-like protein